MEYRPNMAIEKSEYITSGKNDKVIKTQNLKRLEEFDKAITQLENQFEPMLSGISHTDLTEKLSPIDAAKLNMDLSFTMNALFHMYMRSRGEEPSNIPELKTERGKIQEWMSTVRKTQASMKNKPKLDKAAAKRFVKSALWDKTKAASASSSAEKEVSQSNQSPSQSQESLETVSPDSRKRKRKD